MASVIERTIKGGAGFFTASLVKRGFGFLFIVVASRFLGPAEFGVLSLGLSVTGIARSLAVFGLPNTIQRFLSGEGEDRRSQIYGAILLIGGGIAALSATGLYIAAPWLSAGFFDEPTLAEPLRILSISVIVGVGAKLLRAVLQAQEEVQKIVVLDTVRSVGKVLVALLIFLWVRSAAGAAWAVVGAFALGAVVAGHYVRHLRIHPSLWVSRTEVWRVLEYSVPLVLVGFSYFLSQQADRLMLGWLSDAEEVGLYTVTSTLAMVMSVLHGSLISIFKPLVSEAYRNNLREEMRSAYLFVSKWVGAVNGAALLAFVGTGLWVLGIFGAEYANTTTYRVLVILSAMYFISTWVGPTGALLQMTDGHRVELVNTIIFVCSNIGLNYILIQYYGVLGAAMATFGSGVFRNVLQVGEIAYWHGFSPFERKNVTILAITAVGTLGLLVVTPGIFRISFALILITLLASFVLWTATNREKRALMEAL
jgi:O-antigen/teichoic acid export membrane protein